MATGPLPKVTLVFVRVDEERSTPQLTRSIFEVRERGRSVALASMGRVDKEVAAHPVEVVDARHLERANREWCERIAVGVDLKVRRRVDVEGTRSPLLREPAVFADAIGAFGAIEHAKPRCELCVVLGVDAREAHVSW